MFYMIKKTFFLLILISVTVTGCDKDSVSSSGQIRIGQDYWNTGGAYIMPSISSCSIVVYSEGAPETGNGSLARFDLSTDEIFQEYGYFPVGIFSIGEQFDAVFSTGESFDDPGANFYPSEGTLTISGSRRGSCSIEFSGVTSSGIELTAEYKGKIHNAYEDE